MVPEATPPGRREAMIQLLERWGCDVAAAMMEAPGGPALVEESIAESMDFRRAMRKVDKEYGKDWWFKVWGPDRLAAEGIVSISLNPDSVVETWQRLATRKPIS